MKPKPKSSMMISCTSQAKAVYDREIQYIRARYNETATWPPDPAALTEYSRSCTAARARYHDNLANELAAADHEDKD